MKRQAAWVPLINKALEVRSGASGEPEDISVLEAEARRLEKSYFRVDDLVKSCMHMHPASQHWSACGRS
ncbi:hypothetical protein GCM10010329_77220 [Streptomyces spiroverticillatus]|uniref:Uncharacterized protein n=1 Tax=Streptomyces finlayi TaxID=67296 RepID=A0A919CDZ4_9ACTN|nr:hypothetical protein [Streptomyces finlayi]GHA42879.1 hypothetical protein GCM10010329_77220 [Streptomyces spiroverticillatus]GHD13889.1 hypothetical protein GCM10010334_72630 [Streptomyces finlayi]